MKATRDYVTLPNRAVILTAIEDEFNAVIAHLGKTAEDIHPITGTVYERGTFLNWEIAVAEIGERNTTAARETEQALTYYQPNAIIFVGVAGGRKDVKLGDVVIATKIYDYESGKAGENFKPRPITHHSSYRILQRARAVARKAHWLKRVQEPSWDKAPFWERPPKAFIKPIASGTKVIGSTLSQAAKLLDSTCGDALAAEMEGYGFLETVFVHAQVEALVVRGISDLIDDKDQSDAGGFQSIAAGHASAFTFEVLSTLWGRPLSGSDWGDFAGQVNALRYRLTALSSNSLTNKQVRGEVKEICLQLSTLGDQLYLELGKEPEKSTNLAQQFKIKEIIEQAQIVIVTVDDAARDNVLRSYRPLGITLQNALTELMLSLEELEQALY